MIVDGAPDKDIWYVLDPFGGPGGIFDIHTLEGDYDAGELAFYITSVEIEEEWAEVARHHPRYRDGYDHVHAMDFFDFAIAPQHREAFDLVITSPTYGNRMADHHDAKDGSVRNTYKHKLGRDPSPNSSAVMQWGPEYRDFHRHAWEEVFDLLEPGGYFLLNVKDHIRKGDKQPVSAWHRATAESVGFTLRRTRQPGVRGNRQGENHEARVDHENIFIFQKPFQVSVTKMGTAEYAAQSLLKGGK